MTMIGRNPAPEPETQTDEAEDDTEYVGDEPETPAAAGDWLVEVSVTCPDGRRVTSEAWFPEPTMTPRTVGEYLQAATENVRSRVNSLP